MDKNQFQSYEDVLKMDSLVFAAHIDGFLSNIDISILTTEDAQAATTELGELSNRYAYLSSLSNHAKLYKRRLRRAGNVSDYEDMIDKEAMIADAMSSVDRQYRALSKAITVHIENNKELYLTGDRTYAQRG
jgi:hypothetical protein